MQLSNCGSIVRKPAVYLQRRHDVAKTEYERMENKAEEKRTQGFALMDSDAGKDYGGAEMKEGLRTVRCLDPGS